MPAVEDQAPRKAGPVGDRSFGADVVLTVGGKALYVAGGVVVTVLIARNLGPTGQGLFAVAFNLTLMLVQAGSLGLPISNPYFTARDPETTASVVRISLVVAACVGGALAIAAFGWRALAPETLLGIGPEELAIALAALPPALATLYLQGVLLGQRRMVPYNLAEIVQVVSAIAGLALLFWTAERELAPVLAVVSGSRLLGLTVAVVALRASLGGSHTRASIRLGDLLSRGARVYLVSVVSFLVVRIDVLLVNALVGAERAGWYSVATYVAEGLILIPIVVGTNLIPRIVRQEGFASSAAVFRTMCLLYGALCLFALPAMAVAVPIAFGAPYSASLGLFIWLLPGTYALGLLNSLTVHYFVRGYPSWLLLIWICALIMNVLGNVALLPIIGVEAAPIVSSLTYVSVLLAHVRHFARQAGGYNSLRPRPRELASQLTSAFRADSY
jgi:O-antigen/teichoic acid export membrane protein